MQSILVAFLGLAAVFLCLNSAHSAITTEKGYIKDDGVCQGSQTLIECDLCCRRARYTSGSLKRVEAEVEVEVEVGVEVGVEAEVEGQQPSYRCVCSKPEPKNQEWLDKQQRWFEEDSQDSNWNLKGRLGGQSLN